MSSMLTGWLNGGGSDEAALLNRVIDRLGRRRRRCNVGKHHRIIMTSERFFLHRQGERQIDHWGADFAVTIEIPSARFLKTAFFQLKVETEEHLRLESRQVTDA